MTRPTSRSRTIDIVLTMLLLTLPATAQTVPTVSFVQAQHETLEIDGDVGIPIFISGVPPEELFGVTINLTPGTASAGEDFAGGITIVYFFPAGDDTSDAYVQLFDDMLAEDPETLTLEIAPSPDHEIGAIATATLTILDDDSAGPNAWFEVDRDVPDSHYGDIMLTGEPGDEFTVDVVIDELPEGGTTIYYADDSDGSLHPVVFVDSPRVSLPLTLPEVESGAYYEVSTLSIVGSRSGGAKSSSSTSLGQVAFEWVELLADGDCATCMIFYFFHVTSWGHCQYGNLFGDCGFDCEEFAPARRVDQPTGRDVPDIDIGAALTTLRRYRDEVLLAESNGADYVALYDEYGTDIVVSLLTDPGLMQRAFLTAETWVPVVAAVVDGEGDQTTITGPMQDQLLGLFDGIAAVSDGEIAQVLADLRQGLALEDIAGHTADDLQERVVENVRTEARSWSAVRRMFR